MNLKENKNKKKFKESVTLDHEYLKTKTYEGLRKRYQHNYQEADKRANQELEIIAQLNFEAYFLITHDIINFAHTNGFAHVGRGSGANSIVSYCLGLTDVDPLELDLYFERFLNPHRTSPPDFDIDFSWLDRDSVIDYILKKYGEDHSALLASYATFQDRATLRELGKVFGLPKMEIDEIANHPHKHKDRDHITKLIYSYTDYIKSFPKNLSIHAGGILISEEPLYRYTALGMPPKGFRTTHIDMYGAEDLGLYKFDILSQRGLGHIKDSVQIIQTNKRQKVDVHNFHELKKDPKINGMLRSGKTMGCFYVESPAMRMLLSKLQCDNYPTLVAASSIIRPGVASSGMMQEYIYRHHNPDKFEYIHPKMEELMRETYGVMVYQEDVIKVAHHFAKLDLADADVLRRGMSGKYRHRLEFQKVAKHFFDNCKKEGYTDATTKEVWRQIESFAGYSFSKAHSASYAVESYQSLYLKAYHPLEFLVGVINNFGGFYRTEFYVHEARKEGGDIQLPCVNNSELLTSIQGHKIFLGFVHLKNLEKKNAELIPEERRTNGPYADLYNFIKRIPVGLEQLQVLIRIGAFRFTGKPKRTLLWEAFGYLGKGKPKHVNSELFKVTTKRFELPALEKNPYEDAFDEMELLEFPLCNPFEILDKSYKSELQANHLLQLIGQKVEIIGYLVTTKDTRTKSGLPMNFGTFLDRQGDFFDSVHFPDVAKRFPFLGKGFYSVQGKVVEEFGFPMVEVIFMKKLPYVTQR
jgi:DNA polymerase-3 subunit alpha